MVFLLTVLLTSIGYLLSLYFIETQLYFYIEFQYTCFMNGNMIFFNCAHFLYSVFIFYYCTVCFLLSLFLFPLINIVCYLFANVFFVFFIIFILLIMLVISVYFHYYYYYISEGYVAPNGFFAIMLCDSFLLVIGKFGSEEFNFLYNYKFLECASFCYSYALIKFYCEAWSFFYFFVSFVGYDFLLNRVTNNDIITPAELVKFKYQLASDIESNLFIEEVFNRDDIPNALKQANEEAHAAYIEYERREKLARQEYADIFVEFVNDKNRCRLHIDDFKEDKIWAYLLKDLHFSKSLFNKHFLSPLHKDWLFGGSFKFKISPLLVFFFVENGDFLNSKPLNSLFFEDNFPRDVDHNNIADDDLFSQESFDNYDFMNYDKDIEDDEAKKQAEEKAEVEEEFKSSEYGNFLKVLRRLKKKHPEILEISEYHEMKKKKSLSDKREEYKKKSKKNASAVNNDTVKKIFFNNVCKNNFPLSEFFGELYAINSGLISKVESKFKIIYNLPLDDLFSDINFLEFLFFIDLKCNYKYLKLNKAEKNDDFEFGNFDLFDFMQYYRLHKKFPFVKKNAPELINKRTLKDFFLDFFKIYKEFVLLKKSKNGENLFVPKSKNFVSLAYGIINKPKIKKYFLNFFMTKIRVMLYTFYIDKLSKEYITNHIKYNLRLECLKTVLDEEFDVELDSKYDITDQESTKDGAIFVAWLCEKITDVFSVDGDYLAMFMFKILMYIRKAFGLLKYLYGFNVFGIHFNFIYFFFFVIFWCIFPFGFLLYFFYFVLRFGFAYDFSQIVFLDELESEELDKSTELVAQPHLQIKPHEEEKLFIYLIIPRIRNSVRIFFRGCVSVYKVLIDHIGLFTYHDIEDDVLNSYMFSIYYDELSTFTLSHNIHSTIGVNEKLLDFDTRFKESEIVVSPFFNLNNKRAAVTFMYLFRCREYIFFLFYNLFFFFYDYLYIYIIWLFVKKLFYVVFFVYGFFLYLIFFFFDLLFQLIFKIFGFFFYIVSVIYNYIIRFFFTRFGEFICRVLLHFNFFFLYIYEYLLKYDYFVVDFFFNVYKYLFIFFNFLKCQLFTNKTRVILAFFFKICKIVLLVFFKLLVFYAFFVFGLDRFDIFWDFITEHFKIYMSFNTYFLLYMFFGFFTLLFFVGFRTPLGLYIWQLKYDYLYICFLVWVSLLYLNDPELLLIDFWDNFSLKMRQHGAYFYNSYYWKNLVDVEVEVLGVSQYFQQLFGTDFVFYQSYMDYLQEYLRKYDYYPYLLGNILHFKHHDFTRYLYSLDLYPELDGLLWELSSVKNLGTKPTTFDTLHYMVYNFDEYYTLIWSGFKPAKNHYMSLYYSLDDCWYLPNQLSLSEWDDGDFWVTITPGTYDKGMNFHYDWYHLYDVDEMLVDHPFWSLHDHYESGSADFSHFYNKLFIPDYAFFGSRGWGINDVELLELSSELDVNYDHIGLLTRRYKDNHSIPYPDEYDSIKDMGFGVVGQIAVSVLFDQDG